MCIKRKLKCFVDCGIRKVIISNDTQTKRGEFPWHVLIYISEDLEHKKLSYVGGGTLISEKILLTSKVNVIFNLFHVHLNLYS